MSSKIITDNVKKTVYQNNATT